MYDPTVGEFISEDPIGFEAGDANLRRYVGNSPTNGTDPSGMDDALLYKGDPNAEWEALLRRTDRPPTTISQSAIKPKRRPALPSYLNLPCSLGSIDPTTGALVSANPFVPDEYVRLAHFVGFAGSNANARIQKAEARLQELSGPPQITFFQLLFTDKGNEVRYSSRMARAEIVKQELEAAKRQLAWAEDMWKEYDLEEVKVHISFISHNRYWSRVQGMKEVFDAKNADKFFPQDQTPHCLAIMVDAIGVYACAPGLGRVATGGGRVLAAGGRAAAAEGRALATAEIAMAERTLATAPSSLVARKGTVTILGKAFPKEIAYAEELAAKGYDVVVRGKTAAGADFIINGVRWEYKQLEAATINAVRQNIRDASRQAPRVIIDGRKAGLTHADAIRAVRAQANAGRMGAAAEVRVLTTTGEYVWRP